MKLIMYFLKNLIKKIGDIDAFKQNNSPKGAPDSEYRIKVVLRFR